MYASLAIALVSAGVDAVCKWGFTAIELSSVSCVTGSRPSGEFVAAEF
jgi:hypothetical protein